MRDAVAARPVEEHGATEEAAKAVRALARENDWLRECESAERYLLRRRTVATRNEAALDLIVAWHRNSIGHLSHDGFEWRWTPLDKKIQPLIRQTTPGKQPPFIVSLLPAGWLESVLKDKDERAALRSGKRYMSNITIVENEAVLKVLPGRRAGHPAYSDTPAAASSLARMQARDEVPFTKHSSTILRGYSRKLKVKILLTIKAHPPLG